MGLIIAQITDLHIKSESDQEVKRLEAVVHFINQNPVIRAVLATGDLVDDGEDFHSYKILKETLDGLNVPYYLLPGNHDLVQGMGQVFDGHTYLNALTSLGDFVVSADHLPFLLVGLNTNVDGHSYGQILAEQIQWLDHIHQGSTRPMVVMMHHPPINKNDLEKSHLRDIELHPNIWNAFEFRNRELWRQYRPSWSKIKLVISGHFHVGIQFNKEGETLVISPSVAPPFSILEDQSARLKQCDVFISRNPSLTLHRWHDDTYSFKSEFMELPIIPDR